MTAFIKNIKICNGKQAYGKINVDEKEYTFTVIYNNEDFSIKPTIFACPVLIEEQDILDAYHIALTEKIDNESNNKIKELAKVFGL